MGNKLELVELRVLRQLEGITQITESADAFSVLVNAWSEDLAGIESFYVIALTRGNIATKVAMLHKGGFNSTIVDPKVVFTFALEAMASAIIVAHNHPSNRLVPSEEDKRITKRLRESGRMLDVPVLDHIILSGDGTKYYSFADHGILDE